MSDYQSSKPEGNLDVESKGKDVPQFVKTTMCSNDNATLNSSISCSITQGSSDKRRNDHIIDGTAKEDTKRRKCSNGTVANKKVRTKKKKVIHK
jgi:hypothetical protein